MITTSQAQAIKKHLENTGQGFCFFEGRIIDIDTCNNILQLPVIQGL